MEKAYEYVFAYVLAVALRLVGLIVGTIVLAGLPMLMFGVAHGTKGLEWVPPLGYNATWILLLVIAFVVVAVRGGMELVSVDMNKLLDK